MSMNSSDSEIFQNFNSLEQQRAQLRRPTPRDGLPPKDRPDAGQGQPQQSDDISPNTHPSQPRATRRPPPDNGDRTTGHRAAGHGAANHLGGNHRATNHGAGGEFGSTSAAAAADAASSERLGSPRVRWPRYSVTKALDAVRGLVRAVLVVGPPWVRELPYKLLALGRSMAAASFQVTASIPQMALDWLAMNTWKLIKAAFVISVAMCIFSWMHILSPETVGNQLCKMRPRWLGGCDLLASHRGAKLSGGAYADDDPEAGKAAWILPFGNPSSSFSATEAGIFPTDISFQLARAISASIQLWSPGLNAELDPWADDSLEVYLGALKDAEAIRTQYESDTAAEKTALLALLSDIELHPASDWFRYPCREVGDIGGGPMTVQAALLWELLSCYTWDLWGRRVRGLWWAEQPKRTLRDRLVKLNDILVGMLATRSRLRRELSSEEFAQVRRLSREMCGWSSKKGQVEQHLADAIEVGTMVCSVGEEYVIAMDAVLRELKSVRKRLTELLEILKPNLSNMGSRTLTRPAEARAVDNGVAEIATKALWLVGVNSGNTGSKR